MYAGADACADNAHKTASLNKAADVASGKAYVSTPIVTVVDGEDFLLEGDAAVIKGRWVGDRTCKRSIDETDNASMGAVEIW